MAKKSIQMPVEVLSQLPKPPKNFEYSGEFRTPKKGEHFLTIGLRTFAKAHQNRASRKQGVYPVYPGPRFILRKKESA